MKKMIVMLLLVTLSLFGEDSLKTNKWSYSGVAGLNLSQVSLSNWSQGGENSLTWTVNGDFKVKYLSEPWKLTNELKLSYGRTKLGDDAFKVNDNELYNETVLTYKIGWEVSPYVSNTVLTVLDEGYDYDKEPAVKISSFFDPGYVTQSIGFTYDKHEYITTRLGLAFQETFANEHAAMYTDDEDTTPEIEDFKFETGIESVTETKLNLDQNILFKSKLRLFGRFEEIDVWDVRWDNAFVASVNEYLNVNLNVLVVYEKVQSPKTQVKEALQLGLTYKLF